MAVSSGNLNVVQLISKYARFPLLSKSGGIDPIHTSLSHGNFEIFNFLKTLVDLPIGQYPKDNRNNNVFHIAIQGKNLKIIKFLLNENNTNWNTKNDFDLTPLRLAENSVILPAFPINTF